MAENITRGSQKAPFSGRQKPNYELSGHGTRNCRWRKQERRDAAVARQKALCESGELIFRNRQGEPDWENRDYGNYIQVKYPLDWRMMLPEGERDGKK